MNSPFPGMDPYLEQHWRHVHSMLIAEMCNAVQAQLPEDLLARVEESITVQADGHALALRNPDVFVVSTPVEIESGGGSQASQVATEPIVLELDQDALIDRHIEILDASGNRVVTAIELISPWDKTGRGREDYLHKRDQYLDGGTSLVEIDLVRAGQWWTMVSLPLIPPKYRTTYRVTVRRASAPRRLELYPIALQQKLPSIRVPLRPGERDVRLDLQSLVGQVYRNGRFDRTDYSKPCDPPLDGAEAAWAEQVLNEAGRGGE